MKHSNQLLLIELLRKEGSCTRAELSRMTGLAGSSVTRLTQDLIDLGMLVTTSKQKRETVGRKGELVALNEKRAVSLVIDMGINETSLGIASLNGHIKLVKTLQTHKNFEELSKNLKPLIEKVLKSNELNMISISIPGTVTWGRAPSISLPYLNWFNRDLFELIPHGVDILVENEALLSMLAELKNSEDLKGIKNAAFVFAREGVSTGLMLGGNIVKSNGLPAGSFAHTTVDIHSKDICYCGNTGCWELYSGLNWPVSRYGADRLKGENLLEKFRDLLNKSKEENEAIDVLRNHAYNVAIGVANIANAINAQVIIIGGILTEVQLWYLDEIENVALSKVTSNIGQELRIRSTRFLRVPSSLVGAAENAITHFLETNMG